MSALAAELARPWLREGAQILDPFCGTGTLLIERCLAVNADPVYGVDRFGEAVEKARVNAQITDQCRNAPIHFINRDFFEFTHEYPFDEIITELPNEEADQTDFAKRFLSKAGSLLKDEAVLVVVTDAPGALKEALRSEKDYTVQQEYLLNERAGTAELILRHQKT
jgi:tRNA G10  N-methylase Trm11